MVGSAWSGSSWAAHARSPFIEQSSRVGMTERGRRGISAFAPAVTDFPQAGNVRGTGPTTRGECRHEYREEDHERTGGEVGRRSAWTRRLRPRNRTCGREGIHGGELGQGRSPARVGAPTAITV